MNEMMNFLGMLSGQTGHFGGPAQAYIPGLPAPLDKGTPGHPPLHLRMGNYRESAHFVDDTLPMYVAPSQAYQPTTRQGRFDLVNFLAGLRDLGTPPSLMGGGAR